MGSIILYTRMWRSGTGLYAQELAVGLAAAGHEVTFISPKGDPIDRAEGVPGVTRVYFPREYDEMAPVSRVRRALRSLQRILTGSFAVLRARMRIQDIVVTIPEPLLFWLPLLALLRLSGAQVGFVVHDPEPHAWRLPRCLRPIERAAYALSYRMPQQLIVLARTAKIALVDRFAIRSQKVMVIPHGAFGAPDAGPLPGEHRLLVFGTIRRNKQVHVALEAAALAIARGADIHLTVAGGPDPNDAAYLNEVRLSAARLGERARLTIGYIADDEVAAMFKNSDALLLPYVDFESQSGVAVLAGLAGRPVICATAGGIPELIEAGLAAVPIAAPVGVEEVADAIIRFLDLPAAEWTRRAEAGREKLAEALAWPQIGCQFGAMFA